MRLSPIVLAILASTSLADVIDITASPSTQVNVNGLKVWPVHGGLPVDPSLLPPPAAGTSLFQVRPTAELPAPSLSGAFRTVCTVSKVTWDDPIAFPGLPGVSHLHTFFGNVGVDASTTPTSILQGSSTCRGGIANRTAYWVPTLLDTAAGNRPVPVAESVFYYKAANFNSLSNPSTFQPGVTFIPLPAGLRMVAGDSAASAPPASGADFAYRWKCIGTPTEPPQYGSTIPNCSPGAFLYQEVFFPQCWDGVNLDSPNHKSHMSYGVQVKNLNDPRGWFHLECPKTHPVVLPQVAFQISYLIPAKDAAKKWRLSSDVNLAQPAGWTSHGDWFNGWDAKVMDAWTKGCVAANLDCHGHLTGDGREMY